MQNELSICDGCRNVHEECTCNPDAGYEEYPEQYPETD